MPSRLGDSRAPFSLLVLVFLGVGVVVPELGVEDFFSDVLGVSAGFLGVDNRSKIAFLLLLDCVEVVEPADLSDLAESVVEDRFRGLSAFEILSELLLLGVLDLGTSKGTKPGIVPAILAGRGFLGVLISRGLAGPDADEEDMWSPIVLLGRWGVAGARSDSGRLLELRVPVEENSGLRL